METVLSIAAIVCIAWIAIAAYKEQKTPSEQKTAQAKQPSKPVTSKIPKGSKFQRLTIKSIIRWEQLRGKSFSLMDYSDKDDVETLFYTVAACNNRGNQYTLEVFRQALANKKVLIELSSGLERETSVLNQFQQKIAESSSLKNKEGRPGVISDIVSTLILEGLDAGYVMNEMELCDLPMFIQAYERSKKERIEESRMWTYFGILPHIDASKMKNGAKDLIVFPWEQREMEKRSEEALRDDKERFEEFMNIGKEIIKK